MMIATIGMNASFLRGRNNGNAVEIANRSSKTQ
jgi:hypothetical protein